MSNDATDLGVYFPEYAQAEASQTAIEQFFPVSVQPEAQGLDLALAIVGLFCPCSNSITGAGVDSTHVRVFFDRDVLANPAVMLAGLWEIVQPEGSGPITVLSVELEGDPVESVLLTTTEHVSLPNYNALLHFLERA